MTLSFRGSRKNDEIQEDLAMHCAWEDEHVAVIGTLLRRISCDACLRLFVCWRNGFISETLEFQTLVSLKHKSKPFEEDKTNGPH
jgi:hypothetical protein